MNSKLLIVIGTRPELIKLAPIILEFKKRFKKPPIIILNTAQHKDLIKKYWRIFKIKPDFELDFMLPNQTLAELTSRGLIQLENFIDSYNNTGNKISGIIAQGDTTTVMLSSMIAFYKKIPFYHVEAGLRTFDLQNPFPEEYNRKIAAIATSFHFAPTQIAKQNLLKEGYNKNIFVTGNTIVDTVNLFKNKFKNYSPKDNLLKKKIKTQNTNYILITCHRRENQGENLLKIIKAIKQLSTIYKNYNFIWPLHPNPNVKSVVLNNFDARYKNIFLTEPLDYIDLLFVLSKCKLVITDSGGIQEEAPSFNVPVIILRKKTERPEGVHAKVAHLVGTNTEKIFKTSIEILNTKKIILKNPYGDGKAAIRIVDKLLQNIYVK